MEKGKSHVRAIGFGLEEWLLNFSWAQGSASRGEGVKYGFLQPIGKYRDTYEGQTFNVLLYTIGHYYERVAVAEIRNLSVPLISELRTAHREMKNRGWINDMRDDLHRLGISAAPLSGPAETIINVAFRERDVTFFDPGIVLPEGIRRIASGGTSPSTGTMALLRCNKPRRPKQAKDKN